MDANEFSKIFLALNDSLFRMAKSILLNDDEAKDAVQELQFRLWQKLQVLETSTNKQAFVYRSLRNLCIDKLRTNHTTNDLQTDVESGLPDPQCQLEVHDMVDYVKKLIDLLPELQRTVIRLRDVEGFEIDEIAKITNINKDAVSVNLSRARNKIRIQLLNESKRSDLCQ